MPQQLLLEGPHLEALIVRAREEYGPGARVVRAEKVRTGGILGFFTQEHFELTVEVSDAEIARAAATRAPVEVVASRSAIDAALAEEIADAKAARESMLAGTLGEYKAIEAAPSQGVAPQRSPRAGDDRTVPDAAAAGVPVAAAPVVDAPVVSNVVDFDRLVLRLAEQAAAAESVATIAADSTLPSPVKARAKVQAPTPASAHAPSTTRAFVPATFPVAERTARVASAPTRHAEAGSAGFRAEVADVDVDAHAQGSHDSAARTRTMTRPFGGGGDGPHEAAPEPFGEDTPDPWTHQAGASRMDGVVLHRWGVFTDIASVVAAHCTVPALLALGVPMRCVEDYADLGSPVPLLDVVARFGTPPVRRPEPGDLIVVAGPAEDALAVASQLAAWVGLPATAVTLAGEIEAIRGHGRRIRDLPHARALRARAEKAGQLGEPLIVALGMAPGRRGAAASAPLLGSMNADTVWAVIDATKRPSSYEPSIELLAAGGRVDALAAVNVGDAQAPCAMLDASLPVAWMDGLPAAGLVWAALLGERIASLD